MRISGHLGMWVLCAVALLAVGCTTFKEPEKTAASAMLKGKDGCIINAVDGVTTAGTLSKISSGSIGGSMGGNEVRVPPGLHSIGIIQQTSNGQWHYNFRLECVDKHTYLVQSKSYFGGDFVVTDITTGEIMNLPPILQPTTAPAPAIAAPTTMPLAAPQANAISAAPAQNPASPPQGTAAFVQVADPKLAHTTAGIRLDVEVTLNYVESIPFTLHAYLADTNGTPLTDSAGKIDASRVIKTGDETDTDDYKIVIPAARMTSLRLNTPLQVYVELLDAQGKVVSQAAPIPTALN